MAIVSVRTGAILALSWICLSFSLHARSDDQRQAVLAAQPERLLILPAMRVGGFSGGGTIRIASNGVETVSPGSIPRRLDSELNAPRVICLAP